MALVGPPRDRLRHGHPGRRARGHARRGACWSSASPPCRPGSSRERWWRVRHAVRRRRRRWPCRWPPSSGCPGSRPSAARSAGSGVDRRGRELPATATRILALVPYLDGGYGHLGEANFFSQYNLPEVGIYLGILPLIALITLLAPALAQPDRAARPAHLVRRRAASGSSSRSGSNTPLEHLFNSLPLYGSQRLQSRNMITVATAVCVLFAGLDRPHGPAAAARDRWQRYDRIMALVPARRRGRRVRLGPGSPPARLVQVFAGVAWASPSVTVDRPCRRRSSRWPSVPAPPRSCGSGRTWAASRGCAVGRRLRGRRPRADGADEPAHRDAAQRPGGRDRRRCSS